MAGGGSTFFGFPALALFLAFTSALVGGGGNLGSWEEGGGGGRGRRGEERRKKVRQLYVQVALCSVLYVVYTSLFCNIATTNFTWMVNNTSRLNSA